MRAAAGGGKDAGIIAPPNPQWYNWPGDLTAEANLVPTDGNALVFARKPQEVLGIVYGGDATKPGAFFPQGVNGNIK